MITLWKPSEAQTFRIFLHKLGPLIRFKIFFEARNTECLQTGT